MFHASQMVQTKHNCQVNARGLHAGEWKDLPGHLLGFPMRRQHCLHGVQENLGKEDTDFVLCLVL